jgi:hypothetical protein
VQNDKLEVRCTSGCLPGTFQRTTLELCPTLCTQAKWLKLVSAVLLPPLTAFEN